tara:strand:+ start:2189 stop:2467 length:279 start_codon:yes stop_codon:yes gene_type:complete
MSIENPTLKETVETDSQLKGMIVDYVGEKIKPENDEVTLEMVVEVVANEFDELVLAIAEENYIRGYHQGLSDVEEGEKLYNLFLEEEKENES